MSPAAALALAAIQTAVPPPPVICPTVALAATPPRVVTLVGRDMQDWRGPVVELEIAVTADELAAFGKLAFLRMAGRPFAGGLLERRVDDMGVMRFRLSFAPDQLSLLASGGKIELVERSGPGLAVTLAPVDAAALANCIAPLIVPAAAANAANAPYARHSWTFVPLEPNQPLAIRRRGNTSSAYPSKALSEGRQGTSRVAVTIGPDGRIDACTVIVSSGHDDLDTASCGAARRSYYLPATDAKGEPVETKAEQNLVWKMAD
jgi:TonB family protein